MGWISLVLIGILAIIFVIVLLALVLAYFERRSAMTQFESEFAEMDIRGWFEWLVILGTAIIIIWFFTTIPGPVYYIYFDNGFNESYDIFIDGEQKATVKPLGMVVVNVSQKDHHFIEIKNGSRLKESLNVSCEAEPLEKYIYNIGAKNSYVIVTHAYGNPPNLYHPPPIPSDREIGSEHFLKMPDVDYKLGVPAPETILVPEGYNYCQKTSIERR